MLTTRNNGQQIMPLLMSFTPATRIEEAGGIEKIVYDENLQIVYDARYAGTKCYVNHSTKGAIDKKYEIDDKKFIQ